MPQTRFSVLFTITACRHAPLPLCNASRKFRPPLDLCASARRTLSPQLCLVGSYRAFKTPLNSTSSRWFCPLGFLTPSSLLFYGLSYLQVYSLPLLLLTQVRGFQGRGVSLYHRGVVGRCPTAQPGPEQLLR